MASALLSHNASDAVPALANDSRALIDPNLERPAHVGTSNELNIATLIRVLWEWRWLILSTCAVGIAGAIIVTLLATPLYRSTATLQLNPPTVAVGPSDGKASGAGGFLAQDRDFVGTQLGLLRSRSLAVRIAQDLNLTSDRTLVPAGTPLSTAEQIAGSVVQGAIDVKLIPQSKLVTIDAVSSDPGLAARIVNGAADGYISSTLERNFQSSSYARDFLQRQIASVRRQLEDSERELVAYAQQQRLITTGSQDQAGSDGSSLTGETLIALNGALAAAQTKRFAAEQKYRAAARSPDTSDVVQSTSSLRQQVATLNAEYQQKLTQYKPDYPDMVRLKAQIDTLNRSIQSEGSVTKAGAAASARTEYLAARGEEASLQSRVSQLSGQVLDLRGRNIRYRILQRDVDTNRALYDGLLQRYKEIGVAGALGDAAASIVDRGRAAGAPFEPNLAFNLLVGLMLGLVAGSLSALALEFVNDTVKSPEDVRAKLKLAFLGGIPIARNAAIEDLSDPTSGVTEAYFSLASALQYTSETGVPKSILITSTRPAEGKSTSAWALALNLTKLGKTVLMIDADMRRPAFVTGADREIGLSTLLTNAHSLKDTVLRTEVANLWIIPSGPIPPNPPELLASGRMAEVLAEAGALFDVVVVDAPPILGLADAPVLSTLTKVTIMVVEAGRTRTRAAIEAHNRLRAANANLIGAVLTRYRAQASYGYGYGYGYGRSSEYNYSSKVEDKRRRKIQLAIADAE